jgi:hypothetical protein
MTRRLPVAAGLLAVVLGVWVLLAGCGDGGGQTAEIAGQSGTGSRAVRESVARIAARGRADDRSRASRPLEIREKPDPPEEAEGKDEVDAVGEPGEAAAEAVREKPEPGGEGHPKRPGPSVRQQRVGTAAIGPRSSLAADTSFLGAQSSESGFIPPDSMGSVGPSQIVVCVNGRIKVFDKQGNLGTLNVDDSTFWASVAGGFEPTDPGVEYDRLSGRWILSAVNVAPADNRIMIAISSGPTITNTSSFTFFQFSQSIGAGDLGQFADYPQLGVDKNAVYIGVNNFLGSSFTHTNAFVIRKSSLIGGGPIAVTAFRNLTGGTSGPGPVSPQPAQTSDPNVNEGYILGPDNQLFSRLDVRRISDPGGTPSISPNLAVTVPTTARPLNVPASGTHNTLDALDDRLYEAMVGRAPNGTLSLWTAHNIRTNSSGAGTSSGDRDGARWYQLGSLSATPTLIQSGTLFDTAVSNPRFFWIPSIAMNGQGHASLNASTAGATNFAEVASSGRLADDPVGTTEPFDVTQTSSSTYNLGSGNNKRWGDYSQTVVDPTDNMTFWTFQEYANATNSWAVRVIKLRPPPPATPSLASPNTVSSGQPSVSVDITGTEVNGSGFFDPGPDAGGPGFPDHIDAAVSGGVTVNDVTYTDPTHVTLDLDTTGATAGSKDVTITNPDGQSASGFNVLVVDADTTPPDPPTLNGTTPASPANANAPKVFGAAEGGSTVTLYTNSSCTDPAAASDTATTFASPGIAATVPENSTTTFFGTATDISDNVSDCSSTVPSSVTYVEDSTAPLITIDSGPSGVTSNTRPTFSFGATDSFPAGDTFALQCSIDTGAAAFAACSGPGNSHTPASPLALGSYTFRVRATDVVGNSSVSTRGFTVEALETTITKAPKKTRKRKPKFKFAANVPGATFRCKLDAGRFAPCTSPFRPPRNLKLGKHVIRVQALDDAGNVDASPAVRKFRVIA